MRRRSARSTWSGLPGWDGGVRCGRLVKVIGFPLVAERGAVAVLQFGLSRAGAEGGQHLGANVQYGIPERTVRELMPVLSLCDQVDSWRYGTSAGLAVL
jgi:hypothetical protein